MKRTKVKIISRRKQLAEWSRTVRDAAGNKCCVCGATEYLNAHHINAKERYTSLQLDPMNGVCLCPSHHKFGKYSAHRNALWFARWLQENLPDKFNWAIEHLNDE